MLSRLRLRRNRPYLHAVLAAGLFAWLAFLISATCTMPVMAQAMPDMMQTCPDQIGHLGHSDAPSKMLQACSLKPCLESQPSPVFPASPPNGDVPILALFVILVFDAWLGAGLAARIPWGLDPPSGRRIPLIYRFCTLLN
ncbi:hypothetical protein SAMN02949497_2347 [Methylomagnum ishizawai]|uniref:Uncharacterized protein n=1 Tax=Methylomagnum ishizawai TaxID=1760988 RepID=A0A1Y6CXD4_9GAMM|nr:hypothetical protein [Methylomagnum ishizawai]SMF95007.1 hypothetical protein SAMN02949497_2347 [Methylomagnum ishizawai]